jgi:hypothetical protein
MAYDRYVIEYLPTRKLNLPPNPEAPDGAMAIHLGKGLHALVSDCDYETVSRYNWSVHGTKPSLRYAYGIVEGGGMLMHRFLMANELAPGFEVDHVNHNGLDCRRENMRICTRRQNLCNTRKRGGTSSLHKGVSRMYKAGCVLSRPWVASIKIGDRQVHLGTFSSEESAAEAYAVAAQSAFGEFACHTCGVSNGD